MLFRQVQEHAVWTYTYLMITVKLHVSCIAIASKALGNKVFVQIGLQVICLFINILSVLITASNNLRNQFIYFESSVTIFLLRSLLLMRNCCTKWNWQQIVSICNSKHLDTYVGVCWFRTPAQRFGQTIFFVHLNSLPLIVLFINLLTASECCTQLSRCLVKTSLCESIYQWTGASTP